MTGGGTVIKIYVPICLNVNSDSCTLEKDYLNYLKVELGGRLRNVTFCWGNISRIKKKTNLFRKEKTKEKVRLLGIQKKEMLRNMMVVFYEAIMCQG